jgi:hypothetical protein
MNLEQEHHTHSQHSQRCNTSVQKAKGSDQLLPTTIMSSANKRKRTPDSAENAQLPQESSTVTEAETALQAEPNSSTIITEAVDLIFPEQPAVTEATAHPAVPEPATPPLPAGGAVQPFAPVLLLPPHGQGGNRARFMAGMQPTKVSCDLTSAPTNPGMRFSFEAIILVVYPAKTTPPERRYVELIDNHGTTGITVWNAYVHALKPTTVGSVVKFTRLCLTMHNGKKSLTMSKDSTMHVETPEHQSGLSLWWSNLLMEPPLSCSEFHDMPAASVVNISGILGLISQEEKIVNGEIKMLLILYITDQSGKLEIRSWNHADVEFLQYREQPVLFRRVRVCLYAGTRTGELLTGSNGTTITTNFEKRKQLEDYWVN